MFRALSLFLAYENPNRVQFRLIDRDYPGFLPLYR
nr:MAG TPA: Inositol 1,4,5-trisphosphate 3-kinase C [Caudoviricetes sp.]